MNDVPSRPQSAPRALPFGIPPRGWLLSGWALVVVRGFLAFTFLYAGLQKLANPAFFDKSSPYSLYAQMLGYERTSPIHLLLGHLLRFATPLGVLIALGELAVGIGMALGLWTRIAAIGGMCISFSLFLAVSFHSRPWYTGADIVYFFMFTPFVLAGAGGVLSLDGVIARRAAAASRRDGSASVVVPFATIQRVCGFYDLGRCKAVPDRHCAPAGCPYLEGARPSLPGGRRPDEVDRRAVVLGGVTVAAAAAATLMVAGADAGIGRALSKDVPATTTPTLPTGGATGATGSTGAGGATYIGPAADVPAGSAVTTTVPNGSGDPALVIHEPGGEFVAYDAVCPHAGCTVGYTAAVNTIVCPCHGSQFDVATGDVLVGPATVGLTPLTIADKSGKLYLSG